LLDEFVKVESLALHYCDGAIHPRYLLVKDARGLLEFSATGWVLSEAADEVPHVGRDTPYIALRLADIEHASLLHERNELQHIGGNLDEAGLVASDLPTLGRESYSMSHE
jgi:hypothetical protein